jgi:nucleoside-diphosphate-sugar epimerase
VTDSQDTLHLLIAGAAGMIGRKLTSRIAAIGYLGGRAVSSCTLVDVIEPDTPAIAGFAMTARQGDLCADGLLECLLEERPDVIFHLAGVVSGEAEHDFEKGYTVNMDATRLLFERIRGIEGYRPRVVFASTAAVYGQPFPDQVPDDFILAPLTSYGTQKAICELLLNDYSRRGLLDGIGVRLPTVCVRPGTPNKAASGFFSSIIRDPLNGQEAVLPVSDETRHWFVSPRSAVRFLEHAATLDTGLLEGRRSLTMPGVSATVAEQIAALERIAGADVVRLIRREPDPEIERIVAGWPRRFAADRALALGFVADSSFDEIIRVHLEDER